MDATILEVQSVTGLDRRSAEGLLDACGGDAAAAIMIHLDQPTVSSRQAQTWAAFDTASCSIIEKASASGFSRVPPFSPPSPPNARQQLLAWLSRVPRVADVRTVRRAAGVGVRSRAEV